jgi:hypothetical protein
MLTEGAWRVDVLGCVAESEALEFRLLALLVEEAFASKRLFEVGAEIQNRDKISQLSSYIFFVSLAERTSTYPLLRASRSRADDIDRSLSMPIRVYLKFSCATNCKQHSVLTPFQL